MKANVLQAGYVPQTTGINIAGRVETHSRASVHGIAAIKAKADTTVKNLFRALDCPIETEADRHYLKAAMACALSPLFPPLLAVALYQLVKAKNKKGGRR